MLPRWTSDGLYELAGYTAWLIVESYLADDSASTADTYLERALAYGATDPRLTHMHAERLALQGRAADAEAFAVSALASRTTDPGYDELALWLDRWRAKQRRRPSGPNPRPGASPRVARPAGRVRPRRFAV